MGDWTSGTYIASQVVTLLAYAVASTTFFIKNRKAILFIAAGSNALFALSFGLLSAWVGVGMAAIAVVRNFVMWGVNSRRSEQDKKRILPVDWAILSFFVTVMVVTTVFTADGWLSWFGFMATFIYTIGIWQKSIFIYRLFGFLSEVFWAVYTVVVENLVGIIFESVFILVIMTGLILFIVSYFRTRTPAPMPEPAAPELPAPVTSD